jgi:hypothetical protein
VVSSDFQPRLLGDGDVLQELPARLLKKLVDGLADQLFDAPNDLVVDTKSMSAVDVQTGGFIADGLIFGANSRVYHLAYFIQPEVARALLAWLVGPPSTVEVPQGSVVRGALPRSAQTNIVVVSMSDPVSELRDRLRDYPTWVVVRGTGRSRSGRGAVLDRKFGSPAIVSLDWLDDLYSLDTETISARIRGVPGNRAIADALEPGDRHPAPTVDIGEPLPEPAMVPLDDQPTDTVVIERGAPVAVVPRAAPPMSLDVIVDRRPRSPRRTRGVLIDDAGGPDGVREAHAADEPDEVAQPTVTAHVTARMPDRVQHLKPVSVVCTLSRDALEVVGGQQGITDGVDPTRDVIVQIIPIRNAEVIGDDHVSLVMPPPGKVETLIFSIVPSTIGTCEVWVVARQDVRPLVTLSLTANCEKQVAGPLRQPAVEASVPVASDQDQGPSLVLNIYEIVNDEHVSYLYDMLCPELGIATGGPSADLGDRKDYIDSIYRDIENVRINDKDDADRFLKNLQDLGSALFAKLFPVEMQQVLWKHRDKLNGLVVRSNEPFIPWELVHLKDPSVRRRPEEQLFLGQFGLVRWLNMPDTGLAPWPPKSLRRRSGRVRALCATYKNKHTPTLPEIKQEQEFLVDALKATPVDPSYDAVRDLLNEGDFDIFHFAGHGIARDGYTQAVIQIADEEPKSGDFTPIDFSAVSVEQNAELDKEGQGGPLVFLNACQGGRAGVQLGSLGGFAQAFLCGGAGAFVSTLWSVGDNIARTFGEEFYKRLIAGETVSTAVRRAREAGARTPDGQRPDVSWLAYVVYANPDATLEKP